MKTVVTVIVTKQVGFDTFVDEGYSAVFESDATIQQMLDWGRTFRKDIQGIADLKFTHYASNDIKK